MVGASKILTVSYGTFSCTLEGFEDPFSTMKAIAEYFRDLAADDRYFGAEPPTPDAEMLHRIAEREVQHRVEARVQDNGVVLRAGPAAPPADRRPAALPAAPAAPAPLPAAAAPPAGESVAAKLMRIRAAVAQARAVAPAPPAPAAAPLAPAPAPAAEAYVEDEAPVGPAGDAAAPPEVVAVAAPEGEATATPAAAEALAAAAAAPATVQDEAPVTVEGEAPETVEAAAPETAEAAAPETVEAAAPETVEAAAPETVEAAAPEMVEAAAPETVEAAAPETAEDAAPETVEAAAPATLEAAAPEDGTPPAAEIETPATAETETPAAGADIGGILAAVRAAETTAPAPADGDVEEAAAAAPARVILLRGARRAAPADAPASPAPEPAAATLADRLGATLDGSGLEPEAAAELLREVLAVAEEAGADLAAPAPALAPAPRTPEAEAVAAPQVPPPAEAAAPQPARPAGPGQEPDLQRLMAVTESEAGDPETRRRQQAMTHLKAAVAAAEAEREVTGQAPGTAPRPSVLERFRDDLASIVRPRRPAGAGRGERSAADRPGADRPAPLVLVSAQRIDRPAPEIPAESAPVRPRRVSAGNLALSEPFAPEPDAAPPPPAAAAVAAPGSEGFEAFAARLGAEGLEARMEAAAVFTAFVEGIEQFARPQVMRRALAAAEGEEASREAALIAFGRLLREGVIVRSRRGLFEVGPASRLAGTLRPPAA